MNVLPQFSYGMVVISSLSMVGDGGGCEGCWEGVGRASRWEGVGLASGEGRPGSLVYRQIKSLHCSGYLLVCNKVIKVDSSLQIKLNYAFHRRV